MKKVKLKKGDEVIVLTGRSKGRKGKITKVLPCASKVLVEGVNLVKKHVKPDPRAGKPGGVVEKEAGIDISNVAIYNAISKKADKIALKTLPDGKKVRQYKSSGEMIDV